MAIAVLLEFSGVTQGQYDRVLQCSESQLTIKRTVQRMSALGQERTFSDTTRKVCSWR